MSASDPPPDGALVSGHRLIAQSDHIRQIDVVAVDRRRRHNPQHGGTQTCAQSTTTASGCRRQIAHPVIEHLGPQRGLAHRAGRHAQTVEVEVDLGDDLIGQRVTEYRPGPTAVECAGVGRKRGLLDGCQVGDRISHTGNVTAGLASAGSASRKPLPSGRPRCTRRISAPQQSTRTRSRFAPQRHPNTHLARVRRRCSTGRRRPARHRGPPGRHRGADDGQPDRVLSAGSRCAASGCHLVFGVQHPARRSADLRVRQRRHQSGDLRTAIRGPDPGKWGAARVHHLYRRRPGRHPVAG